MARKKSSAKISGEEDPAPEVEEERPEDIGVVAAVEPVSARQPGYSEFEIDIEEVLRQTLPNAFSVVEAARLNQAAVDNLPAGSKGAYLLFLNGKMVYADKTDTRHGFRQRLGRHSESVQHRIGLDPTAVSFKALRIMVFSAFDVEAILINEMRRLYPGALTWNDSGFGSNGPGRKRDDGQPADYDVEFPVDVDRDLAGLPEEDLTVSRLLRAAKAASPYLPRYGLHEHGDMPVTAPQQTWTMRRVLKAAATVLPSDFQVTVFHGRVIL